MKTLRSFVSLGAGNLATHLCRALSGRGFILKQIYSRSEESCFVLASEFKTEYTTCISEVSEDADFYLVAVSDHALPEVLRKLKITRKLIFHTAGTYGLDVYNGRFSRCGILYPLQTFIKTRPIDLSAVPVIIEGCDKDTESELMRIAEKISGNVLSMKQEKRRWLHLAAVFASNFTNHMYALADDILKKENLDFRLLYPLMEETLRKAQSVSPEDGQTGPAIRGDINTMNYHLNLLAANADMQKLYTFMSRNIRRYHQRNQSKNRNEQF